MHQLKPEQTSFDVVIIGAGPAGLSAALWCDELGLSALLIESAPEAGGQLLRTYNEIRNHLGVVAGCGREMRDIFLRQLADRDVSVVFGASLESVDLDWKEIALTDGRNFSSRSVIIATGVSRRRLDVHGELQFENAGVIDSGKRNRDVVRGKSVVIVGGGDAAMENALILSETASRVFLVHRRAEFSARPEFVREAGSRENVTFLTSTQVMAIDGEMRVRSVVLRDLATGGTRAVDADYVLIRIGVEPNSEPFTGQLELDANGYIKVDGTCLTSLCGVYAVGDVANPAAPTISSATGMGATAAKAIFSWLQQTDRL